MARPTLFNAQMIEKYTEAGYWDMTTLSDYWERNARDHSNRGAIVDSRTRLTWAEAKQWIDRLALGFLELSFKKDDMVVLQLPNCVELIMLRLACERAGLLCLPVLTTLRYKEMEHIVRYVKPKGVVISREFRGFNYTYMIEEIRRRAATLTHVFVVDDQAPEGTISLNDLLQHPLEERYPPDYLQRTKCPAIGFSLVALTTGTTGHPKFVQHPICSRLYVGRGHLEKHKLDAHDVIAVLSPAPGGPNHMAYFAAPQVAARVVLLDHFDPEEAFRLIEKEAVTVMGVVPAQLSMMVKHPNLRSFDLSSLRLVQCVGALLPYEQGVEAEEKLGCPVVQSYGSMDFGNVTMQSVDDPFEVRLRTVGKLLPGNELILLDEAGREVENGEIGEILVRGPSSVSGYHLDMEATRHAWSEEGWFRMGDLGKIDKQGNLTIVGRKKEVIIRGGQNIYPVEIEGLLITHPKVFDVAVVGMPDPIMGERVCSYVVPKPGQQFTLDEAVSFLKKEKIAPYKLPERMEVVDKLPTIAEGQKVDKRALVEELARKLQDTKEAN